jgi:hypothetical protein
LSLERREIYQDSFDGSLKLFVRRPRSLVGHELLCRLKIPEIPVRRDRSGEHRELR